MGLSIGDVEKITGISKDRLRYYEEKNLITPVRRRNRPNRKGRGILECQTKKHYL